MPSLKEVRSRITSVQSTQQITKAMKMVAAAKLRRSQDAILRMRPYAQRLSAILGNLSRLTDDGDFENVYAASRDPRRVLIVAITADRGLCGAFNANIVKGTYRLIQERYATQHAAGNVTILTIGRKGAEAFARRNEKLVTDFTGVLSNLAFENVRGAAERAMQGFREGEFDRVEIIYNEFKNVATQVVRAEQMLPLQPATDAPATAKPGAGQEPWYTFEPSQEEIMTELIPKSLKIQLYKAVLESNASFNGAQMTAMDKATENAGELLKELRLTYNRSRQAAITKEILEIVGGAEALSSGK